MVEKIAYVTTQPVWAHTKITKTQGAENKFCFFFLPHVRIYMSIYMVYRFVSTRRIAFPNLSFFEFDIPAKQITRKVIKTKLAVLEGKLHRKREKKWTRAERERETNLQENTSCTLVDYFSILCVLYTRYKLRLPIRIVIQKKAPEEKQ